jgi:hypothetical protein
MTLNLVPAKTKLRVELKRPLQKIESLQTEHDIFGPNPIAISKAPVEMVDVLRIKGVCVSQQSVIKGA